MGASGSNFFYCTIFGSSGTTAGSHGCLNELFLSKEEDFDGACSVIRAGKLEDSSSVPKMQMVKLAD